MKNKTLILSVAAVALIVLVFAINTYAVGPNAGAGNGVQVQQQQQTANQGEDAQIQTQAQTQTQNAGEVGAQVNAEQFRGTVANSVQSMIQVADRQPSTIGNQVRVIAQQQNQSATTTVRAMEKIQARSKIQTFLFGSDYKNLGALRSEVVQTRNRLQQLNNLMTSVQNEGDKTELQSQIQVLEQEQVRIESFIKAQEGTFSLFGWLAKMFNK
jgi:hypothetical protein